MRQLILASASPRRTELLRQAGYSFQVHPSDIKNEQLTVPPPRGVELLALEKARNVARSYSSGIVLGADTIVLCDGKILGKPVDEREALEMLSLLSGRKHEVITAFAIVDASGNRDNITDHLVTVVSMRVLDDDELSYYAKSGEPMDKAGAYGIQGFAAVFIDSIEGCYFNVVGLPLGRVYRHLSRFGVKPFT